MSAKPKSKFLFLLSLIVAVWGNALEAQDYVTIGYLRPSSINIDIRNTDSYESVFIIKQIAQSLVEEDRHGRVTPSVAKYWTVSSDMKRYTFYLHQGLKFHNGEPITPHDVAHSLNIVKSSPKNPISIFLEDIESIEVSGELSVTVTLKRPWPAFLPCLSSGLLPVFSKKSYEKKQEFVGSGPYKLEQDSGNWVLRRNSHYIGNFPASIPNFRILTMDSAEASPDIVVFGSKRVSELSSYNKIAIDSFITYIFMFNPRNSDWKDIEQRLAMMNLLLDAKRILAKPLLDDLQDLLPKGMFGHDIKNSAYRQMLPIISRSKIETLNKKVIKIGSYGQIPNFEDLSKFAQNKHGIKLENVSVDGENYLAKMKSHKDIDVFAIGWGSIFSHPDAAYIPFNILGMGDLDSEVKSLLTSLRSTSEAYVQYEIYRQVSHRLITQAYMLPQAQVKSFLFEKPIFQSEKTRYRYTVQLSDIKRVR